MEIDREIGDTVACCVLDLHVFHLHLEVIRRSRLLVGSNFHTALGIESMSRTCKLNIVYHRKGYARLIGCCCKDCRSIDDSDENLGKHCRRIEIR